MPLVDPARLKLQVQAEAQRLGFALCGVTRPAPPPHLGVFQAWLAAGRQAGMSYLADPQAAARRADPALILPGCAAIIVLGMEYPDRAHEPAGHTDPEPPQPPAYTVARYAQDEDYHRVIPARLEELARFLNDCAGQNAPYRVYTDTGPILERDLAQQAGLGWIGRNTCLIHPRLGSFFFLAEIFTTLALPADQPLARDYCGSCARCVQACPTGCIRPDRTLEAGRCIAYQTIENKGPIAPDLRAGLGGWVFGCDICQTVCPWNRFAPRAPAGGLTLAQLLADLRLTPAGFNQKYRASPISRAKRRGYLRNLAAALGNARRAEAVPALIAVLQGEAEALVRGAAAWALGQTLSAPEDAPGGEVRDAARAALESALEREPDADARAEMAAALERLGPG
jgi:epoxyqueuosine reductase